MPLPPNAHRVDRATLRTQLDPAVVAGKTDAQLDAALATVDQDAVYDELRAGITVTLWDRVSPINGVPASHFHARDDVPAEGDVYLVSVDGAVVGFQPHEPELEGIVAIPRGQGLTRGKGHADTMAASRVPGVVLERVAAKLNPAPTPPAAAAGQGNRPA